MLDIKFIRENLDRVKMAAKNKNIKVDIDELLRLDEERREAQGHIDELRQARNKLADSAKGRKPSAENVAEGRRIKDDVVSAEKKYARIEAEYLTLLERVPNVMHPDVPVGKDDGDNIELEVVGEPTKFDFPHQDHLELGKNLDILDFETAANVSGSGFFYVKNELVFLELALVQYAFNKLVEKNFTPFITPDIARAFAMKGTGYNPRGNEDQIYEIKGEDAALIATAEIPLGAYLANKVLREEDLPVKYVGFSHCFRKEGGAYGKE